mmetsp:Transcript_34368/g.76316  ORF Transcript_34368/g.76316 Transcript_34368/m.76316 type:complete len:327 (+) Transcript_34368:93-1073(+)
MLLAPSLAESRGELYEPFRLSKPLSMIMLEHILAGSTRPASALPSGQASPYQQPVLSSALPQEQETCYSNPVCNSNWKAPGCYPPEGQLDNCCLGLVLSLLTPRDLARVQVVSRQFQEVCSCEEVRRASFMSTWGVAGIVGYDERSWQFLQSISSPRSFVRRHPVVPSDSLQRIAVQHGADLTAIKRLNNIISDHSCASRRIMYIPAFTHREELEGQLVKVVHDSIVQRTYPVVLSRQEAEEEGAGLSPPPGDKACGKAQGTPKSEQLRRKMCSLLGRSLHIDDDAASYYLEEADGDVKKAMQLAEGDASWESCTPRRRGKAAPRH